MRIQRGDDADNDNDSYEHHSSLGENLEAYTRGDSNDETSETAFFFGLSEKSAACEISSI